MGVRILAYDKYRLDRVGVPVQVEVVDHLSQIQSEADIISLHLPLTEETRHLVDRTFLSACRFGVVIMNTARGGCMDTAALIEAMDSGQVSGVCMDVFEQEKPERYTEKERLMYAQLFGYDQAVFSPHVAGWTFESKRNLAHILLDKIKRGE
jgi:D-3-phosphoglycerate dehydrogenase